MAQHKSAKKTARQTLKRALINKSAISRLRSLEKTLLQNIKQKNKAKALDLFKAFVVAIDRSCHKGQQHKNKVRRKKSQLARLVNTLT